jgi:hypothetical protein
LCYRIILSGISSGASFPYGSDVATKWAHIVCRTIPTLKIMETL